MTDRANKIGWGVSRGRGIVAPIAAICLLLVGCTDSGSGSGGVAASLMGGNGRDRPLHPHVVVVVIDALRADRLGVNGYPLPTTPSLDLLAAEGINFTRFYSHSTWTKPSISTLFTSLYPSQHGVRKVAQADARGLLTERLGRDLVTLAERFRDAGYATVGVVNQIHLQARFGFDQGFESYESRRGTSADKINTIFARWLDRRGEAGPPIFAYLHYLEPHWPYNRMIQGQHGRLGGTAMSNAPPDSGSEVDAWLASGVGAADRLALATRYDQDVALADAAIGGLVELLRKRGLDDDALLVVTSDHGEAFFERGLLQHSYEPFEELVKIPLVIRLPRASPHNGTTVDEPAGLIDLMPTLLELAGLEREFLCQGRSLVPWIEGATTTGRPVFMEHEGQRTVRGADLKLMQRESGERELFDLRVDPGEMSPVTSDCGGECQDLHLRLDRFIAYLDETSRRTGGKMERLAPEDLEELEALGYL